MRSRTTSAEPSRILIVTVSEAPGTPLKPSPLRFERNSSRPDWAVWNAFLLLRDIIDYPALRRSRRRSSP